MSTVFSVFKRSCQQYPRLPFLHIPAAATTKYCDGPVDLTYGETLTAVEKTARYYLSGGYGAGHRVALLLENRREFFIHWFALNSLGCSIVPVNGDMQAEEIAYLLDHSEACLVVSVAEKLDLLEAVNRRLDNPLPIVSDSEADPLPPSPSTPGNADPGPDTECALLYTSGSTGKPKGCILTNEYFTEIGAWYRDLGDLCHLRPGRERLITPLPLVHMNAMAVSTMGMIMTGGCIVQLDRFHPSTWWRIVRETKATVVHYLGVMPAILLNMPPGEDDFSGQIRFAFGAGVNPKHHRAFEERFGFPLIEAWGMTECGAHGFIIASREPRHVGTCCFGRATPNMEYRLVDENGRRVPAGEPGELLVRASGERPFKGYFAGYLKNPEATAEATAGDWLHTGDVVRQGEDGSLYFVDRRKNVIRRSGENISALEVEAALVEDRRIAEVVVTAVPDDIRGDEVMACILLADGEPPTQDTARDIVSLAREHLVYYKIPGYVAFCDDLPRTASQKPQRGEIKSLARRLLDEGECFDLRDMKKRAKVKS